MDAVKASYRRTKKNSFGVGVRGGVAVSALAMAMTAGSQSSAQEDGSRLAVDQIVVTAQKRAENLQDVPVAITGLSEKRLEDTGFDELSDLTALVPSFAFGNFGPVVFTALRGVGFENTTAGGDPSVTFHLDDVYLGRPVGAIFSMFDTERVEVLRGPQGTLYGRNATGGSINLITKKPDQEFGGEIDAQYGNYNRYRVRGAVNLPLSENLQTRIVGFVDNADGFTSNSFPGGDDGNEFDSWGVRGHIAFTPSDRVDVLLSANYVETGGTGATSELREPFPSVIGLNVITPTGQGAPILPAPPFGAAVNDLRAFNESVNSPLTADNSLLLLSGKIEIDLGALTLKSVTGYVETVFDQSLDTDFGPTNISPLDLDEMAEQFTQEVQITSNFDGPFNFIAGFYYFTEDSFRDSKLFGDSIDVSAQQFGLVSGVRFAGGIEAESIAGFLHTTFEITPDLTLTAGARFTHDEKYGLNNIITTAIGGPPFALTPVNIVSTTEPSWRFSLDYHVTDSVLTYVSYARGYKSGGVNGASPASNIPGIAPPMGPVNQGIPVAPGTPSGTFNPEFIDTIEIGFKSQLFDNRMQLNAAAFYSDYRDLQFQVFNPFPVADNAGSAEIFGVEMDFQASLSEYFQVDGSFGYLNTEYTEFNFLTAGGIVDLTGNQLNRSPRFAGNFGANIYLPIDPSWGETYLRADVSHKGKQFFRPFNVIPDDQTESYSNTNLRLFWTDASDAVTVELFVTNLFNSTQETNILRGLGFLDAPGGGGQELLTYNPPRQYGARVAYRF